MVKNILLLFCLLFISVQSQSQSLAAGWTLTTDTVQCLNHNMFFGDDTSVVTGNYNKTWYYGDGDSCHCIHANHSYKAPGIYEIKLVIEQNGLRDSMSHWVSVLASASPNFSMSTYGACRGTSVIFTDTVAVRYGAMRIWDFGDGTFDTAVSVNKIYQIPGSYAPMLKYIYLNGCNDSNNNLSLDIYPAPSAKISVNAKEQCFYGNYFEFRDKSVNDTGLVYTRKWTGTVSPANGDTVKYIFSKEGSAWLKLFYDGGNGCTSSDSIQVVALKNPVVDWTYTTATFCEGDSFSLSVFGSLPPGSYPWLHYQLYKNDTLIRDDTSAIFRGLTQSGNYLVKSFNGICADSTTSFFVTGIPKMKSFITRSGDTLFANKGYHYQWFYNGQYINGQTSSFLLTLNTGIYQVLVTDTFGCGQLSDSMMVWMGMSIPSSSNLRLYPNPFQNRLTLETTESGSAQLQVFTMEGKCIYESQFNGNMVLETSRWNSGIYVLRCVMNQQVITRYLIRE